MISCYTLLAVYLSSAGALDVPNLDHAYASLKKDNVVYGQVSYSKNGRTFEDTFLIDSKPKSPHKFNNDETTVDKCETKGKVYFGAINHFEMPLK